MNCEQESKISAGVNPAFKANNGFMIINNIKRNFKGGKRFIICASFGPIKAITVPKSVKARRHWERPTIQQSSTAIARTLFTFEP
jgi:hypothetical protein